VIADADRSLAAFLTSALPAGTVVSVETPTEALAAAKHPTVSCFLHRIVEDTARRVADVVDLRGPDGRVTGRQAPVRHYQLHYLVSAWAPTVDDEHGLLADVMRACLDGEVLPLEFLTGVLDGEPEHVLLRVGLPIPDRGPAAHDVWSSLGVPLRASVDLVLVAPLRPVVDTEIAAPAESITVGMEAIDASSRLVGTNGEASRVAKTWTTIRIKEKP
jgi:hypothetical protein